MFSAQASPVAIDFGSASIKLLQVGGGERPPLLAAAEVPIPDSIRGENERLFAFYNEWLPKILRDGKFKGKRAVIAVPSAQTHTQHMQITETDGLTRDAAVKAQLQAQMGVSPTGVVVRSLEVCPVVRNNQSRTEMICFAIAKDTVMRYVELLKKCKLEVVGVHTETMAMIRAFDHLKRRDDDAAVTTLFVDLGWAGTRVAITHGKQLTFGRSIAVGGRNFDQLIAAAVNCDMQSARAHRLALKSDFGQAVPETQAASTPLAAGMAVLDGAMAKAGGAVTATPPAPRPNPHVMTIDRRTGVLPKELNQRVTPGDAPRPLVHVDFSELLDTITDELSMCLRYHQGLFKGRALDRAIFIGGEARQAWLCQHVVKTLRVPAQMGDPIARFDASAAPTLTGFSLGQPQPGWTVACGLCNAPTDL